MMFVNTEQPDANIDADQSSPSLQKRSAQRDILFQALDQESFTYLETRIFA